MRKQNKIVCQNNNEKSVNTLPQISRYYNFSLENINNELTIKVQTNITKNPLTLLIDTGAQVSLLAGKNIAPNTIFFPSRNLKLIGISGA